MRLYIKKFCYYGLISGVILLGLTTRGLCQIVWQTTMVEKSSDLDAKQVIIRFPFTNKGKSPETILSVHPLCSCTTVDKMKTTYVPGESGVLSAVFTVGDRVGLQEKYIDVQTSDAPGKLQRLTFRVHLPEPATLIPNHLVWKMGDNPTPETMEMNVKQATPVKIVQATSSDPNFKVEIKPEKDGFKYKIVVTPAHLFAPTTAKLTIQTDYPPSNPRQFTGLAEIKFPGK